MAASTRKQAAASDEGRRRNALLGLSCADMDGRETEDMLIPDIYSSCIPNCSATLPPSGTGIVVTIAGHAAKVKNETDPHQGNRSCRAPFIPSPRRMRTTRKTAISTGIPG